MSQECMNLLLLLLLFEAISFWSQQIVTILACVTWKMLGKKMLDHLDDVEQYYKWW